MTAQRIRNITEHYVGQRECSQAMLREVLGRRLQNRLVQLSEDEALAERQEAEPLIEGEVARMVRLGLVDDARFAEMKARAWLSAGRGGRRIMMDLLRKGVDRDVAEEAMAEAAREVTGTLGRSDVDDDEIARSAEWEAAETFARKRRIGPFRSAPMPEDYPGRQKIWRREASAMARAGFDLDLIRQVLDREPGDPME